MFKTKKTLYRDTVQQHNFTTKPPRGSEIRSPRANPFLWRPYNPAYMYCPSHTLQKDVSATYLLQHHYIIKPHLPSEIRSPWATHSLGALQSRVNRFFVLCIILVPLHVYNNKKLYKDTLQQKSSRTKHPRGSEIRSLRATSSLGSTTTSRTCIAISMYG